MSGLVSKGLIVLGLCLGALGAAGFHAPRASPAEEPAEARDEVPTSARRTEKGAWPLFAGGLALLAVGSFLGRRQAQGAGGGAGQGQGGRAAVRAQIEGIRDAVVDLDEHKAELGDEELRRRIDELLGGAYFDLTSRHDDIAALLGFADYARVWDGVASAERMLARCWSMTTDGHGEEGLEELPRARQNIERAVETMAGL